VVISFRFGTTYPYHLHPQLTFEDGIDRRSLKSHIILNIPQKLVIIKRLEIDENGGNMVISSYSMGHDLCMV
jgi:hypothetical protein